MAKILIVSIKRIKNLKIKVNPKPDMKKPVVYQHQIKSLCSIINKNISYNFYILYYNSFCNLLLSIYFYKQQFCLLTFIFKLV